MAVIFGFLTKLAFLGAIIVGAIWGPFLHLGIPFRIYIAVFLVGLGSLLFADQVTRRIQSRLASEMYYTLGSGPAVAFKVGLSLLGGLCWNILLVLPFLQFRWTTALGWIAVAAIAALVMIGVVRLPDIETRHLVLIERVLHVIAIAATVFLWAQALTTRWV